MTHPTKTPTIRRHDKLDDDQFDVVTAHLIPTALGWDDVKDVAEDAFAISVDQSELRWAEHSWQILTAANLTLYSTWRERGVVACRFLALAALYRDFGRLAWDEDHDPDYGGWADSLELGPFTIGQLIGDDVEVQEGDEQEAIERALAHLADDARAEVVEALKKAHGGAAGLFLSLWRSIERPDDEEEPESDDEILNYDVTGEKLAAYTWIEQGCPP